MKSTEPPNDTGFSFWLRRFAVDCQLSEVEIGYQSSSLKSAAKSISPAAVLDFRVNLLFSLCR